MPVGPVCCAVWSMSGNERRDEPDIYAAASVVFGSVIMIFGLWAAIKILATGEGAGSIEFVISVVFVLLGGGRVYWGLRRHL